MQNKFSTMFNLRFLGLIASVIMLFYSCGNDNPVNNNNNNEDPQTGTYFKILTAENGALKFELWSATASSLRFGYNKIAIKVFENSAPKTSGFVKFFPWLQYSVPTPMKSTPVSAQFNFTDSMFTGYAIFTTISGSGAEWKGKFNYNNQLYLDSASFTVNQYSSAQIIYIQDMQSSDYYYLSLLKPYNPAQGLNTFQVMLHKTTNDVDFEQVNNATIRIMPWMDLMGHGSPNNVDPAYTNDGIYQGTVNFNMGGQWSVYDTVYVGSNKITGNIPPKFTFNP